MIVFGIEVWECYVGSMPWVTLLPYLCSAGRLGGRPRS